MQRSESFWIHDNRFVMHVPLKMNRGETMSHPLCQAYEASIGIKKTSCIQAILSFCRGLFHLTVYTQSCKSTARTTPSLSCLCVIFWEKWLTTGEQPKGLTDAGSDGSIVFWNKLRLAEWNTVVAALCCTLARICFDRNNEASQF